MRPIRGEKIPSKNRDELIITIGSVDLRCKIVVDGSYNINRDKGRTRLFSRPAIESLCSQVRPVLGRHNIFYSIFNLRVNSWVVAAAFVTRKHHNYKSQCIRKKLKHFKNEIRYVLLRRGRRYIIIYDIIYARQNEPEALLLLQEA